MSTDWLDEAYPEPLPHVTPEAVESELAKTVTYKVRVDGVSQSENVNFELKLKEGRDFVWLAMAVRYVLSPTIPDDDPSRKSNTAIRDELEKMSQEVQKARLKIPRPSVAADRHLWHYAWQHSNLEGRHIPGGEVMGEPSDYLRVKRALAGLDWLGSFLQRAATETKVSRGRPATTATRILRGRYLAPIFEAAYPKKARAKDYRSEDKHSAPTHFMDFYSRMVSLAFDAHEASNLPDVLKEACRLHRQQPVEFGEDIIPRL